MRYARIKALMGDFCFYQDIQSPPIWGPPSSRLLVFVSSTFTDTHEERNILQRLLPELREKAVVCGVDVIFCDLRSGIPDENALDHLTWLGCQRELFRCFSISAGHFFLSLQSSKYGYMPIPKFIDQRAFDQRLIDSAQMTFRCCTSHADLVALAQEWYHLDTNANPPVYVLKNLTGQKPADKEFWDKALPWLRELFEGVVFDRDFPDGVIGRSVTEYEVKAAIMLCGGSGRNNDAEDKLKKGVRWIYRRFDGGVSQVQQVRHPLLISIGN